MDRGQRDKGSGRPSSEGTLPTGWNKKGTTKMNFLPEEEGVS